MKPSSSSKKVNRSNSDGEAIYEDIDLNELLIERMTRSSLKSTVITAEINENDQVESTVNSEKWCRTGRYKTQNTVIL